MSDANTPGSAGDGPSPYGGGTPAQPLTAEGDRQAAMWSHIGGIIGFLPSLIIFLVLKDRGPRTAVEAKEALNWQITITIAWVAVAIVREVVSWIPVLGFILGGLLGLVGLALWIVNVVFSIIGGVRVSEGGSYRYPVNLRLIK